MSTIVPVTTDTLPNNVPKFDVKGMNWAIFAFRFQVAIEAKEVWDHFNGTSSPPSFTPLLTPDQAVTVKQWQKSESLAKHLLTQRIPDSTALRIQSLVTVCDMWNEITREYTEKGAYAQRDLRAQFLESKLPKGTEVRHFLDGLQTKKEELAAVSVTIDEKDYRSTIIKSLLNSLANFASNQLAAARLFSTSKTIEPDILISIVAEEAERQKAKHPACHDGKERGEAMAATEPNKYRHGGRGRGRHTGPMQRDGPKRKCWDCGSTDHLSSFHKQPTGQKEDDKSERKGKAKATPEHTAHAAIHDSDSKDGVFGVSDLTSDNESIPDLETIEDSDDEQVDIDDVDDWFSVDGEDSPWDFELEDEEFRADEVDDEASVNCAGPLPNLSADLENAAMKVSDKSHTAHEVDLFDSGTTRHISPYRERFENYSDIPLKPFVAANRQRFCATGVGDMVIEVPNGYDVQ